MYISKRLQPCPNLLQWIKTYWVLEAKGDGTKSMVKSILPDGCVTILMILKGRLQPKGFNSNILTKGVYVIPPILKIHDDILSDDLIFIDIHLKPSIFYKLFNIPIEKLKNNIYTFNDLSLSFDKNILDRLSDIYPDETLLKNELDSFFDEIFYNTGFFSEKIITDIQKLYLGDCLDKFYKSQNLSMRQVERKVKNFTGLTPKKISRLGRFYSILEQIKFNQFDLNLADIAFEYKFSDQSHFIREFKSFSNKSPIQFINDIDDFPQYIGLCNLTTISEV